MRALNYCVVAIIQIGKILQLPHCISELREGREEATKSFLVTGFHFLYYASHLPVYSKAIHLTSRSLLSKFSSWRINRVNGWSGRANQPLRIKNRLCLPPRELRNTFKQLYLLCVNPSMLIR